MTKIIQRAFSFSSHMLSISPSEMVGHRASTSSVSPSHRVVELLCCVEEGVSRAVFKDGIELLTSLDSGRETYSTDR